MKGLEKLMKQNSKKIRQFFAALLGVLLILNSLSLAAPSMVYAEESETQIVEETADEAQEEVSDVEAGEEAEPGDAADEEEAAEEEAEEPAEEAEPSEEVPEEVEEEAEVEEVEETEEEAEPEEAPQEEEAEEEPELLEEEKTELDFPQFQADNDGKTVLAFTSDIHNGTSSGSESNVGSNRLTTWLSNVSPKYNNNIGVFGFCGDMAGANTNETTFWTFTKTVMDNITSHNMDGVYAVGNHEYMNGQMATATASPEVRGKYKLNAEGRAVSGENYVMYCLGTNSSHGSSWAYDDSQITSLTNYLNSVSNDKVIIILTHFPLHDYGMHRTGNTVPVLNAINAAAVGADGTYGTSDDKKIVFL